MIERYCLQVLGIGILKVASGIGGLLIRDDKARCLPLHYLGIRCDVVLTGIVSNKNRIAFVVIRFCYVWNMIFDRAVEPKH